MHSERMWEQCSSVYWVMSTSLRDLCWKWVLLSGDPEFKGAPPKLEISSDLWNHRSAAVIVWPSVRFKLKPTFLHSRCLVVTCSAVSDGGGENICSVNLWGKCFFFSSPFPSEPAIPEDAARMSGFCSKSNTLQRASEIARCPPSVCVTCQMPCHHHHHQSKPHQSLCESVCVCICLIIGQSFLCFGLCAWLHLRSFVKLFFINPHEEIRPLLFDLS